MNFKTIQKKNPNLRIRSVNDTEFERYGRILHLDADPILTYTQEQSKLPESGSSYEPDIEKLHPFSIINRIKQDIYGSLPIEVGICHGHNSVLTGLEYHVGPEVNIAVTDCLLALGRKESLQNNTIQGDTLDIFYIPQGKVIELYEGTLHYCPFSADQKGFSTIVILLDKTNTSISYQPGSLITKRNKWFIAHVENTAKIEAGNVAGLLGTAIEIKL